MEQIPEISCEEASKKLTNRSDDLIYLDVREAHEYQEGHIKEAIFSPLSDFQNGIKKLDPSKAYIVVCRSGGRSGQVTQFMLKNGFTNVHNMVGGMQEWSAKIDPSIKVK